MKKHPLVGKTVIHKAPIVEVKGGKFVDSVDRREVRLMATSGIYAMVRRPKGMPYVAPLREIEEAA